MEKLSILVLCTGNSCRSIMAEALLNELGSARVQAYSAGSQPAGFVHPQALACLNRNRIPVHRPRSKSWDDFASTRLDLVITVCANAAGETCPVFPGAPVTAHWGVRDPARATGSEAEIAAEFEAVFQTLRLQIERFLQMLDQTSPTTPEQLSAGLATLGSPDAADAER